MFEKIAYQASERRMYDVSPDQFSRARIKVLRDAYLELNRACPGLVSIALWGSLAKGKRLNEATAPAADVDYSVFIDLDALERTPLEQFYAYPTFVSTMQEVVAGARRQDQQTLNDLERQSKNNDWIVSAFPQEHEHKIEACRKRLAGDYAERMKTIVVKRCIMHEIRERWISAQANTLFDIREKERNDPMWRYNYFMAQDIREHGSRSLYEQLTQRDQYDQTYPDDPDNFIGVAQFFALDVGGGSQKISASLYP